MKRSQMSAFAAVACAMAVTVSAQQTPPAGAPGQTPSTSAQRSEMGNKVTVTGCLEKSTPAPTGTSGAAATGASAAKFMLNNVTTGTGSPSAPAGTSGAARATASSYSLDGEDSKLSPHVGHKVEITGTVEDRPASPRTDPAAPAPSASASASAAPKLKVEAVKMIASSCTP